MPNLLSEDTALRSTMDSCSKPPTWPITSNICIAAPNYSTCPRSQFKSPPNSRSTIRLGANAKRNGFSRYPKACKSANRLIFSQMAKGPTGSMPRVGSGSIRSYECGKGHKTCIDYPREANSIYPPKYMKTLRANGRASRAMYHLMENGCQSHDRAMVATVELHHCSGLDQGSSSGSIEKVPHQPPKARLTNSLTTGRWSFFVIQELLPAITRSRGGSSTDEQL